jgi:hypothetical protein
MAPLSCLSISAILPILSHQFCDVDAKGFEISRTTMPTMQERFA